MGAINATGSTYDQRGGCILVTHSFSVAYNTSGIASAIKIPGLKVKASATKPVLIRVDCAVGTVFNAATTNVLTLGTSSTATEIVAAAGINEASATFQANVGALKVTADADIYVKYAQTGTAATTGAADFYITLTELNPLAIV